MTRPIKPHQSKKFQLSFRKKLLFATATTLSGLLAVEFVLFVFGIQPALVSEDPYVGFAGSAPLFVSSTNTDSSESEYRTAEYKLRWFNDQRFPVKKSAKAYRIFCLGGSTTYGHPYHDNTSFAGWLRELLPQVDGSKQWEVINCGGISYASYRVAKLVEELAEFEPDLFIVYSGHNEFLEARTYSGLRETPSILLKLGGLASRTRTFSVMSKVAKSIGGDSKATGKDNRQNLLPTEVDTLLDNSIGPLAFHRDDQHRQQIVEHFGFNLQRITQLARGVGANVIFVTPASNLGDCSPFKSEIDSDLTGKAKQDWQIAINQARELLKQSELQSALTLLNKAISLDSRNADSLYLRGRVLNSLNKKDEARKDFLAARDEDVCTLRATTEIIEKVRSASAQLKVPLIDFEQWVEQNSPDGIPGDALFLDHVHGTIEAYRDLAVQIIPAMKELGSLSPASIKDGVVPQSSIDAATVKVMAKIDSKEHGIALRNISKVYSWAGKKEDADRIALRALELTPDDADTIYQAANAYVRLGEVDKAIALYPRAAELQPEFAASVEASLGYAYGVRGDEEKNIEHYLKALELDPSYSDIHYNIATIFEKRNELSKAELHYAQAISGNPNHLEAHFRLGLVFAKQKRWQPARERFQKAVSINPTLVEPRLYLGKVSIDLGDKSAAMEQFRWILAREPAHPEALKEVQRLSRPSESP